MFHINKNSIYYKRHANQLSAIFSSILLFFLFSYCINGNNIFTCILTVKLILTIIRIYEIIVTNRSGDNGLTFFYYYTQIVV